MELQQWIPVIVVAVFFALCYLVWRRLSRPVQTTMRDEEIVDGREAFFNSLDRRLNENRADQLLQAYRYDIFGQKAVQHAMDTLQNYDGLTIDLLQEMKSEGLVTEETLTRFMDFLND